MEVMKWAEQEQMAGDRAAESSWRGFLSGPIGADSKTPRAQRACRAPNYPTSLNCSFTTLAILLHSPTAHSPARPPINNNTNINEQPKDLEERSSPWHNKTNPTCKCTRCSTPSTN
jgi:hypothetical protein